MGWGGGALQLTAASLSGESSWVMGNGKIINRPKEEKKKYISKALGRISDGWRGREAGFNMGLIENKIELI